MNTRENEDLLTLNCQPDCGHSEEEHRAFDEGHKAGLEGKNDDDGVCPYTGHLKEIWMIGNSCGLINHNLISKVEGGLK